jgi:WD40 repeat protein
MGNEPPSLPLPSAPYRGIEPFRFVDQPIFSARTDEVRKLVRLITIYRGIFFYGESGAGKSSLINAGLSPALRDEGFAPERVRVQPIAGHELVVERIALTDEGTPPFLPSRFAASAAKKTPEPARVVLSVEEFVRCTGKAPMPQRQDGIATSGAVPVLIFDQFEELITLFEEAPDSREKFNQAREIQGRVVEMLLQLLGDLNLSIKLVLSFREDYLAKVSRRLAAAPQLGEQAFRLSFPPEIVLRKIIRGPFESASIPAGHFTRRLSEPAFDALESSFRELSDTGKINLTEVQIACLALWENEEEEKAFLKEREPREAVRRLFGNYLDRALNRLEYRFRKPAITALTFLVTSSGTRNIVSEDDLLGNVVREDHLTQPDAREVLKALSRTTRLVFRQTRGDSAFYEITSEFLIPWITEKRQARERDAQLEKQREELARELQLAHARKRVVWLISVLLVLSCLGGVYLFWLQGSLREQKTMLVQTVKDLTATQLSLSKAYETLKTTTEKAVQAEQEIGRTASRGNVSVARYSKADGKIAQALAQLAQALRLNPENREASGLTAALLSQLGGHVPLAGLMRHDALVNSAQFSPDGQRVMTISRNAVWLWDAASGKSVGEPMKHEDRVNSAQFSPNGQRLVTVSEDKTVRLWDAASGKPVGEPMKQEDRVNPGQFSPAARLWDAASGKPVGEPSGQFSPDGQRVMTVSGNAVRLWDAASGKPVGEPMEQEGPIESGQVSPDGQRGVTVSGKTVRLWDIASGKALGAPMKHEDRVNSARFSLDGQRVMTIQGNTVRLWDAANGKPLGAPMNHGDRVNSAQFSPDGRRVVTVSVNAVQLWDAANGKPVGAPMNHEDRVNPAQFSLDGQRVMTIQGNTVRLWDAASGKPVGAPMKHENRVNSAQFSPDGRRVVTVSVNAVQLWDAASGEPVGEPMKHEDRVNSAQFSLDGQRVMTIQGNTVRLWDAPSGKPVGEPMKHENRVNSWRL